MSISGAAAALAALALLSAALPPAGAAAEPYRPTDPREVLERVASADDADERAAQELERRIAEAPEDLAARAWLARLRLARGREENDPRFFGRARAAFGRFWDDASLPPEPLVLRAAIRRAVHDFPGSLRDLEAALAADPGLVQAHFDRATTLLALGDPVGAAKSCAAALGLRRGLAGVTCLAGAASLAGAAEESRRSLAAALDTGSGEPADTRLWAATVLGEISLRLGDTREAERRFAEALIIAPDDLYARLAVADLFLAEERWDEAGAALANAPQTDAALLRLVLAARGSGDASGGPRAATLAARIEAAAIRGDETHLRDAARFRLEAEKRPQEALGLAGRNWARQKGPEDARLLIEAAAAANEPEAAAPALEWIAKTRIEDVALDRARRRLAAGG